MGTADQLEIAYAGDIVKWDDNGDGTINVYGMATDPTVDLDGQSCDPEWLKAAMPDWFASAANIREQHGSVAAGVGKELTHADGDKWMLKSHIVDPATVAKVKHGVLKGYSVGIREGKVLRGKAAGAPNGKIVGGKIVEVSLVDRPCNPLAIINIAKAAPGSDELEMVAPELVDIDPSVYLDQGGQDDESGVEGAEDESGVLLVDDEDADDADDDGEQDSQAVDGAVDDDAALSLFDEIDVDKGLLSDLIRGPKPKKDADGDGRVGEGSERSNRAARRKAERERRARERAEAERHRGRMDAEAARDANHAQQQGRRMEAGEHRQRLGRYEKAFGLDAVSAGEHRAGMRLVRAILAGELNKSLDTEDAAETVAVLAELVISEAEELALVGADAPEDVSGLLDVVAAIAKYVGAEATILKSAGSVVDESTATATLDIAEIVKAQVSQEVSKVTELHKAEIAKLSAELTEMKDRPVPSALVINKSVMPSPAASVTSTKATQYAEIAANPALAPSIAAAYREAAELERRKG